MALKKQIIVPQGITAEYWNIRKADINWSERTAEVILNCFISEDSRRAGNLYITKD